MSDGMLLSSRAAQELESLTNQAQHNQIEAQKFAIEAAKLISVASGRLKEYKNKGFFKRCWYAVSGKTAELERANQSDLIQMQRFAWIYLVKLQEQNLLQAKAIAVIRNNLKELQDEVGELSDQISVLVGKFDARLNVIEGKLALHDWLLHVGVDNSIPREYKCICFLQLVFSYLKEIREKHIDFANVNACKDIDAALNTFGIDWQSEMTIEQFIAALFADVEQFGLENFKKLISIRVDDDVLSADVIFCNSVGTVCSALYAFEKGMVENGDLGSENRLAVVRAAITRAKTKYTLSEFGREILGAYLIAEEIYRAEHGSNLAVDPELCNSGSEELDVQEDGIEGLIEDFKKRKTEGFSDEENKQKVFSHQPAEGKLMTSFDDYAAILHSLSPLPDSREFPIVYFGMIKRPNRVFPEMLDPPEHLYAKLKIPDIKFDFKEQVNVGACKEILDFLRSELGGSCLWGQRINPHEILGKLLSKLNGANVLCNKIWSEEDQSIISIRKIAYKYYAQSDTINEFLEKSMSVIVKEIQPIYARVLAEKARDDAFLKNKTLWIRLAKREGREEGTFYKCSYGETGKLDIENNDYVIEQNDLVRYTPVLERGLWPSAVDDLAGLYKCDVVSVDEENLKVSIRSDALYEWEWKDPRCGSRIRAIRNLLEDLNECIKRKRENLCCSFGRRNHKDFRYEQKIDDLYKQLREKTNGGWDPENCKGIK